VRPPSDPIALVERIRGGDVAAEDAVVRLFERDVYRLLQARTHDREATRELSNDVLMAVVCALRAGRLHEATRLRAFVKGIVRNVANNYLRARIARPREESLDAENLAAGAHDGLESAERLAFLQRGLSRLSPADRQILTLTMGDGLKPRQIALHLGLSAQTVRARKSRALHRLLTRLSGAAS
jgi:RNA polymerase sigma-70 factor (ECF subfamily)